MTMFKPGLASISRVSEITTSPVRILEVLGEAFREQAGDGKVDREWCFVHDGKQVNFYAYCATNLVGDPSLPSPAEFWASEKPFTFSIASVDKKTGELFREYLQGLFADASVEL